MSALIDLTEETIVGEILNFKNNANYSKLGCNLCHYVEISDTIVSEFHSIL